MNNFLAYLVGRRDSPFEEKTFSLQAEDADFEKIYSQMVAGRFKLTTGMDYEKTAYWLSREALNTDRLALHVGLENGYAFYVAIPSSSLSDIGRFSTGILAAVPGHTDYKGDGAYVLNFPERNFSVAILKNAEGMRIVSNEISSVLDLVEDAQLTVYDCAEFTSIELKSKDLAYSESAFRISLQLTKYSIFLLIISSILYALLSTYSGIIGSAATAKMDAREAQIQNIVDNITLTSPVSVNLAKINRVTSIVMRAGGWMKFYYTNDKMEIFELELPEWVSKDYIDALGQDIQVDRDKVRGVLVVKKGDIRAIDKSTLEKFAPASKESVSTEKP